MFNNGYGIVNYLGVDLLHLYEQAPLWFDNPGSSFVLVVLFAIWRYFPYAFISFLAILQTIDKSLYEAAEMDGANAWQRFRIVTLPAIMPVLATVVTLRTIWMFYMFADVYLLTTKVDILGVYLYKTAFAFNDLGKAAAISVVLFIIIFAVILLTRKRVLTTKVDILGVYLYKTAFAFNDLGKAAAISVVLFIIIFAVILLTRKRVNLNGNK